MTDEENLTAVAHEKIGSTNLSAIEHLQLRGLLLFAVIKDDAARFVLNAARDPGESLEENLRSLNRDMSTLVWKCTMRDNQSPQGVWRISVFRDDPVPSDVQAALKEREHGRCFHTGWPSQLTPTWIVPPSIASDPDLLPGVRRFLSSWDKLF